MKIATYNVNGVNGRLPVLRRWLEQSRPDVAYLQELKAPDEKFPVDAIREVGRGRLARTEGLERRGDPRPGRGPGAACTATRTTRTAATSLCSGPVPPLRFLCHFGSTRRVGPTPFGREAFKVCSTGL